MRKCLWFLCWAVWSVAPGRLPAQSSGLPEAAQVPLLDEAAPMVAEEWRWRQLSGEAALEEGFSSLAANFFRDVLGDPGLPTAEVFHTQLNFVTALLASQQLGEASAVLAAIEPEDAEDRARVLLRSAWLSYLQGGAEVAGSRMGALDGSRLPAADHPWWVLLQALVEHSRGNFTAANQLFDEASASAPTEGLRDQFELLRLRGELLSGSASEEAVAELKMTARSMRGQAAEAEAARLLAVALTRLGRSEEALEVIERELQRPGIVNTPRRFDFLLLLALIAGDESGRGRLSLRQILSGSAPAETQRIALGLLARAPFEDRFRSDFLGFLGELIDSPRTPALLDELLGTRAMLRALAGRFDGAEADALRLIEQFPGSSLFAEMHRLLAYLNWSREPPRYRTAASYLNQLRGMVTDPGERAELTVMMGDCYFLNGDYLNASDAYGSALREPEVSEQGTVLFQRVIAEVRASRLDEAERILDESAGEVAMQATRRWQAEWNLLDARRAADQAEHAFRRLRKLLNQVGTSALPPALEVRIRWLEARLTLEADRASETPGLVDQLLRRLAELPDDTLSAEERAGVGSHALLLKGEALLTLGQRSEALAVLGELRTRYPDSGPDMLSYLIEARIAAAENSVVDAQSGLVSLADRFPQSRYAPIALWEAALQVEQRGLDSSYREAIGILERLLQTYPHTSLAYYARLKQADLSRKLNDFGTALVLYERLLGQHPDHPERYRAELSRADVLFARGSASNDSLVAASVIYERLSLDPSVPLDAQVEAGFKWGKTLQQRNLAQAAREAFYTVKHRALDDIERAVRLGPQGRYWMSRSLLELGSAEEGVNSLESFAQARSIYRQLIEARLPGQEVARSRLERLAQPG